MALDGAHHEPQAGQAERSPSAPLESPNAHLTGGLSPMGFDLDDLGRIRPYAFHNTCRVNFDAIRRHRELRSACEILNGSEHAHLLTRRRATSVAIEVNGEVVVIRDNRPLRLKSLRLAEGWSLADWLKELNSRVFLWPGNRQGPIPRGRAHLMSGDSRLAVVIRMSLTSLVAANRDRELWVTRCNSGSARHQAGEPVRRGPETFQLPKSAPFRAFEVVELSYVGRARIPKETEWALSLDGPWRTVS